MGKLTRVITSDGSIVAFSLDSKSIVSDALKIHKTSPVATAALGRLLTATSIMGIMLKGANDTVTVRVKGDGPIGRLITIADSMGNVRGTIDNPQVDLPLNSKGKLDVGEAVGKNGTVFVTKDLNLKEPYNGQTELVSGEIAEDITNYFATSEQIPTVCSLGVLVDTDCSVKVAGGFIIQLLPFADPDVISKLEDNLKTLEPVTTMLDNGLSQMDMLKKALNGFELEVLNEYDVQYKCSCSKERVDNALRSMGKTELQKMLDEQGHAEVKCHFCNTTYNYNKDDIKQLIKEAK